MNRKLELEDTSLLESKNAKPPTPQSGSLFFCHCVMITAWEEREKYLNEALTWLLPGILKHRAQAKKKNVGKDGKYLLINSSPEWFHIGQSEICVLSVLPKSALGNSFALI